MILINKSLNKALSYLSENNIVLPFKYEKSIKDNNSLLLILDVHVSNEDKVFWKSNNFEMSPDHYCLVHGDLNSSNILLDDVSV